MGRKKELPVTTFRIHLRNGHPEERIAHHVRVDHCGNLEGRNIPLDIPGCLEYHDGHLLWTYHRDVWLKWDIVKRELEEVDSYAIDFDPPLWSR